MLKKLPSLSPLLLTIDIVNACLIRPVYQDANFIINRIHVYWYTKQFILSCSGTCIHLGLLCNSYPPSAHTKLSIVLYSFDYSEKTTVSSVKKSLECLQVSSLDVVLIHDVEFAPSLQYLQEVTIPALVNLKNQGFIRSIGISGDVMVMLCYNQGNLLQCSHLSL